MKKILLIATAVALVLGASTLAAQNTSWKGTYWGDPTGIDIQGTWNGTIYDNPMGPAKPHFEGKWFSDVNEEYGSLYATLATVGQGIYKVEKGVVYDKKGAVIGSWVGVFDLVATDPGRAEGEWKTFNDPDALHHGFWKGVQVFPDTE
jgi:hypothetical protein